MAKLGRLLRTWAHEEAGKSGLMFWCPGCECGHVITTVSPNPHPKWSFDGNVDAPTFAPSVRVFAPADPEFGTPEKTLCHLFVRGGHIQFLNDCDHKLAGQTVPMQPIPDDYGGGLE